jgi:competence protein ComEA
MDVEQPRRVSWAVAAALLTLALVIVGGTALLLAARPAPATITILPPPPTATDAPLGIYVTGAVALPMTRVDLPSGSRVEDAVRAAGGAAPDADLTRLNLARLLHDGEQVHVPRFGEDVPAAMGVEVLSPDAVRVNSASAAELEALPGIGAALAARIIADREANGAYTSLDDLARVEGIGASLVERLRGLVRFD